MTAELITGGAIVLIGGIIQGCAGFGFGLVTVPVLMLLLPYDQVPPILVLLAIANNIIILVEVHAAIKPRIVLPLLIGGIIGLPLGGYVLSIIEPGLLKLIVGAVVLVLAVAMLAWWKRKLRGESLGLLPVGFISGTLTTATSIGGPPVVLFLSNQDVDKKSFRANIVAYFLLLHIGAILVFNEFGFLDEQVLVRAGLFLAPVLAGTFAGVWISRLINETLFRRVVLTLVSILALVTVLTNVSR